MVEVDGLTQCLKDCITGEIVETEAVRIKLKSLRSTPAPVLASELPNVSFDVNEIIAYAKKRGVAVWELTEADLAPFMHGSGDWRAFRRKYYSLYGMPSK